MISRLILAALLSTSFAAQALTYTESTDFPGGVYFGPPPYGLDAGTLDVGVNKVFGSLNGICFTGPGGCNSFTQFTDSLDSQDSFVLHVAAGTQLNSFVISNTLTSGPAGFTASVWVTNPSGSVATGNWPVPINGSSSNILNQPLTEGVYNFSVYGQSASALGYYTLPYTLTFDVSAVPEPASAGLLLCGGLLLAARRRRRG